MSSLQLYLSDEQKKIILDYVKDKRFKKIFWLIYAIYWTIRLSLIIIICGDVFDFLDCMEYSVCLLIFILYIYSSRKDFGFNCDMSCIKKDNYSLNHAKFVGRKENSKNKHPYYIYDNSGNLYICPVFLDYRNAVPDDNFLYITLNNGRRYAILDN